METILGHDIQKSKKTNSVNAICRNMYIYIHPVYINTMKIYSIRLYKNQEERSVQKLRSYKRDKLELNIFATVAKNP